MWRKPVGLGAMRTRTLIGLMLEGRWEIRPNFTSSLSSAVLSEALANVPT